MNSYKKNKFGNSLYYSKNKYNSNVNSTACFKAVYDDCHDGGCKTESNKLYNDFFIKDKYYVEHKTYNCQQQYCNNCGKYGHLFSNCIVPITSLGIIAFRKKTTSIDSTVDTYSSVSSVSDTSHVNEQVIEISTSYENKKLNNEFEYLMIQRIDSFGYVEFMRGKYSVNNYSFLKNIIDEMTIQEKQNILTKPFDELWVSLWGEYSELQYKGEQQTSKNKYLQLKNGIKLDGITYNLESLVLSSTTRWENAEWGFPKGKRNNQEKDLDSALREFTEETGYNREYLNQVFNVLPYEEIFIGSNMKCYKNKYFLHYMNTKSKISCGYQKSEVKNMKWLSYDECMNIIRPYNIEKKKMLTNINNALHKFYICNI